MKITKVQLIRLIKEQAVPKKKVIKESKEIFSLNEMINLKKQLGVRDDWHEPDEQEVTVKISGNHLDNAGAGPEFMIHFLQDNKEVAQVNLANLCAFASGLKSI